MGTHSHREEQERITDLLFEAFGAMDGDTYDLASSEGRCPLDLRFEGERVEVDCTVSLSWQADGEGGEGDTLQMLYTYFELQFY